MLIDFIAEGFDGAFYFLARHNRKIKYKDTIFFVESLRVSGFSLSLLDLF